MSKFIQKINQNLNSINQNSIKNGYEYASSFNSETTYSTDTKYLIVGILTPPNGRKNGYFYTSFQNRLFCIIDACYDDGMSLCTIKNKLEMNPKDHKLICNLKDILNKRKIAFLDVIKEAIVSKTSSSDETIDSFVLDNGSFKRVDYDKTKIIVNSKNAKVALEKILKEINKEQYIENIILIPQSIRGYTQIYKSFSALIAHWKDLFFIDSVNSVDDILKISIGKFSEYQKMLANDLPEYLYKFYPLGRSEKDNSYRLETIKNNQIWFSKHTKFNDPFELASLDIDKKDLDNYFKQYDENEREEGEQTLLSDYKDILDDLKRQMKIACFCRTNETNLPLWAHYANNHEGFCIKYKVLKNEKEKVKLIRKVKYNNTYEKSLKLTIDGIVAFVVQEGHSEFQKAEKEKYMEVIKYLASFKSISWSYEDEYRIFYFSNKVDSISAGIPKGCDEIGLEPIEIYIGMNCKSKYIELLKEIANNLGLKLFKMKVSDNIYGLESEEISL